MRETICAEDGTPLWVYWPLSDALIDDRLFIISLVESVVLLVGSIFVVVGKDCLTDEGGDVERQAEEV